MNNEFFNDIIRRIQLSPWRRVPRILQTEASECGLACLVMVCRYFGMDIDLLNMRRRFGISSHGATLATIIHIAGQLSLKTRPLSLDIDEICQLKRPCLLHWDMSHFVVLVAVKRGRFIIHDPAFGRRVVGLTEISRHFSGVALEVWPDSEFIPVKARSN